MVFREFGTHQIIFFFCFLAKKNQNLMAEKRLIFYNPRVGTPKTFLFLNRFKINLIKRDHEKKQCSTRESL
jgi:hypothetical protein